jgi:hypothetical protein
MENKTSLEKLAGCIGRNIGAIGISLVIGYTGCSAYRYFNPVEIKEAQVEESKINKYIDWEYQDYFEYEIKINGYDQWVFDKSEKLRPGDKIKNIVIREGLLPFCTGTLVEYEISKD